ncbi:hypothetical protein SAMN05446037_100220 [Anaerovirgula multivorans]|uniref:Cof subfamily of IIB subfamily of haloacid dehalogenase superfamily/HAD-superfamily hydrolase, subfamily IIB n=1 Tax=Anaerovirgula multivorans TaxID=312168 RepID=A0A239AGL3_9FIRM|nr:Cof-type HAD-IIB family hydrolase [Anaerovirgula multivorans]SNR94690.1 hypothetical protein SAMN05446037_100220 [Anaerovirgula multivorans]
MIYKLLATDMDGTLLMNNKVLSQENIEALKRAKNQGVEIVICTGRPYPNVKPYLEQLGFDCWVITNNGAVIRNKEGKIISAVYMKPKALEEAIVLLQKENIYFHVSDEKYTYIKSYRERIKNIQRLILQTGVSNLKAHLLSTWFVFFNGSHKKVNFSSFIRDGGKAASIFILSKCQQQLQNISKKLKDIKAIDITSSGYDNVEVLDENATKGKALQQLAKVLNINQEAIIAVGDNYNDLSMIEYAGLGVAMNNAEKAVIEKANWVTKSNEEHGIAHLVRHFIEAPHEAVEM